MPFCVSADDVHTGAALKRAGVGLQVGLDCDKGLFEVIWSSCLFVSLRMMCTELWLHRDSPGRSFTAECR